MPNTEERVTEEMTRRVGQYYALITDRPCNIAAMKLALKAAFVMLDARKHINDAVTMAAQAYASEIGGCDAEAMRCAIETICAMPIPIPPAELAAMARQRAARELRAAGLTELANELENGCLSKITAGMPFFVLIGSDPTAEGAVRFWVRENVAVQPELKVDDALSIADRMSAWPKKVG